MRHYSLLRQALSCSTPTNVSGCFYAFIAHAKYSCTHNNDIIDTLLLSAIPAQLAAFLMTCVRKSIMSAKGWHYWYSFSFLLALSSLNDFTGLFINLAYGTLLYSIRRWGRVDKYILWACVSFVAVPLIEMPQGNPFLPGPSEANATMMTVAGMWL